MFGSKIRKKSLVLMCQSLSTTLHAGLDLKRSFKILAGKAFDPALKKAVQNIDDAIQQGDEISEAMADQGKAFPELMIHMMTVAEHSGHLPEVLKSLARHYEKELQQRREFIGKMTIPVIQLFAAIFIIAFMLWVIGVLAPSSEFDPIGLGLKGTAGATLWLTFTLGGLFGCVVGYWLITKAVVGKKCLDGFLLMIPVVGKCLNSFAISRFSWAYALTQQTGQSILKCIEDSLNATNNGKYMAAIPDMKQHLQNGDLLSEAMRRENLFTEEYIQIVEVAEESGTVPEQLDRLSEQFEEEARRNLTILVTAANWSIRCLVAMFIIFLIFSMALQYINMLDQAAGGA